MKIYRPVSAHAALWTPGQAWAQHGAILDLSRLRARVLVHAERVFGARALSHRWLLSPSIAIKAGLPADLLATWDGLYRLDEIISAIEHGVYL